MRKSYKLYKAFILVGFPGTGKTTLAHYIATIYPNTVLVDFDNFYISGKPESAAYLKEIEKQIKKHNVVLSKNHHTVQSRTEVIDILQKYNTHYYILNLLPNLTGFSREEENNFIDFLLERIENRNNGSQLVIDKDDKEHSRKRAKNIIIFGFLKKYEPPESFIQLDFLDSVENNMRLVVKNL
jgi:adenylate kinase family enzyme